MKREDGLGVVGIVILIAFICAVIYAFYNVYKMQTNTQKDNDIKSNMLLIQGASKVLYESCVMNKTDDKLLGYKLSEIDGIEEINKKIINEFKEKNIIEEGEYEKYYVLTDSNLNELKVDVTNEENAYYIVGYEKNDIIITCGYNGKYRLEDIASDKKIEQENVEIEESKENGDLKQDENINEGTEEEKNGE